MISNIKNKTKINKNKIKKTEKTKKKKEYFGQFKLEKNAEKLYFENIELFSNQTVYEEEKKYPKIKKKKECYLSDLMKIIIEQNTTIESSNDIVLEDIKKTKIMVIIRKLLTHINDVNFVCIGRAKNNLTTKVSEFLKIIVNCHREIFRFLAIRSKKKETINKEYIYKSFIEGVNKREYIWKFISAISSMANGINELGDISYKSDGAIKFKDLIGDFSEEYAYLALDIMYNDSITNAIKMGLFRINNKFLIAQLFNECIDEKKNSGVLLSTEVERILHKYVNNINVFEKVGVNSIIDTCKKFNINHEIMSVAVINFFNIMINQKQDIINDMKLMKDISNEKKNIKFIKRNINKINLNINNVYNIFDDVCNELNVDKNSIDTTYCYG